MSEEVQLLKNMTQGFAKTSTQASFAALGVFLLGMDPFIILTKIGVTSSRIVIVV